MRNQEVLPTAWRNGVYIQSRRSRGSLWGHKTIQGHSRNCFSQLAPFPGRKTLPWTSMSRKVAGTQHPVNLGGWLGHSHREARAEVSQGSGGKGEKKVAAPEACQQNQGQGKDENTGHQRPTISSRARAYVGRRACPEVKRSGGMTREGLGALTPLGRLICTRLHVT